MRSLIGRLLLINENKWFSSAQNRSRRRQRSRGERLEQSRREDPWTHRHRHTSTLTVFFPREKQRSYGIDYWLINQPQSCNQWRSVTLLLLLPPPRRPWIPERVWSVRSWWSETVSAGKLRCFTCSPRTVSLRWESSSDHRVITHRSITTFYLVMGHSRAPLTDDSKPPYHNRLTDTKTISFRHRHNTGMKGLRPATQTGL